MKKTKLSFSTHSMQFYKKRHQKRYYLGVGKSATDREGYERAIDRWRELQIGFEQEDVAAKTDLLLAEYDQRALDLAAAAEKVAALKVKAFKQAQPLNRTLAEIQAINQEQNEASEDLAARAKPINPDAGKPAIPDKGTIEELFERWNEHQQKRVELGKVQPNAPRHERLSESSYANFLGSKKRIVSIIGSYIFTGDVVEPCRMLREAEQKNLVDGNIKAGTFNQTLKIFRMFIGFLADEDVIENIPVKINKLVAKYQVETSAKEIDLETIKKIWRAADSRGKTFIALGLNAGYYSSDIATLEPSMIQDGYIVRPRQKTGQLTKHKLWKITAHLIEKNGKITDELIFNGKNGLPLVHHKGAGRTDAIGQSFKKLMKTNGIEGITFSNLRDTAASMVERIDPALTEQFLGHADRRIAKHYIDNGTIDSALLDSAIDQLEKVFNLS